VVEFCPEFWLRNKKQMWSVLFYKPEGSMKKSISQLWRALADVAPSHNKHASIGAVDCTRFTAFCDSTLPKGTSLPAAVRYTFSKPTDGDAATSVFAGEFVLEDLAAWASASEAKEEQKQKRRRRRKSQDKKEEL